MISLTYLVKFTVLLIPVTSFSVNNYSSIRNKSELKSHTQKCSTINCDRRKLLKTISTTVFGIAALTTPLQNAVADVSQGNALPKGAAAFNRIIRVKGDLKVIGKRVKEHADEINTEEWESISVFLRRLYSVGEDMKGYKVTDAEKQKKIMDLSKILQKLAEAGDIPVQKGDAAAFLVIYKRSNKVLEEFFDLISDVPDEI